MKIAVTLKIRGGVRTRCLGKESRKGAACAVGEIGDVRSESRPDPDNRGDRRVVCIQGGGVTSINANGKGWDYDVCFTLNALDVHGVCFESDRPE